MSRLQEFRDSLNVRNAISIRNLGGIIIFLANALSSYLFFIEYGSDAFARFGQGAPLVAGLWGFLVVDIAYMYWRRLKDHDAETVSQVSTAKMMFFSLFVTSVCISALYFGMATLRVLFVVSDDFMWYLNLAGLIFLTAPVIVNIVGYNYYVSNSLEAQQQKKRAEIRQLLADTQLEEDERLADLEVADRERALEEYRPIFRVQNDDRYRRQLAERTHRNAPRQPHVVASDQPSVLGADGVDEEGGNEHPNS